jgi:hypothetical protein
MDLDLWMRLLRHGDFLGLPDALAAFRVAQQSLSVENDAGIYAHQKAIMAELAASRHFTVRRRDATVGLALAPTGRLRRHILFAMSKRAAHRDARVEATTAEERDGATRTRWEPVSGRA